MAWRNRITGMKNRPNTFRKLNIDSYDEVEDDAPLLVQSSSSFTSSPISIRNFSPNVTSSLSFSKTKSLDANSNSNNIAAVPDEIEALSFREDQQHFNNNNEKESFVAQFQPNNVMVNEEGNENGDTATIFDDDDNDDGNDNVNDDHSSNDGSVYTEEDCKEGKETHGLKSLRAPSITGSENKNEEDNISRNYSTSNSKSSKRTRNRNFIDEDADDATWNADEVDAFVDANDFGNRSGSRKVPTMTMIMMQPPTVEISGVDLLKERDSSVNELQEVSHLMTFNALVLIQKQKDWIEGSSDATNGANKGSSSLITMELENLERKIKLLMDHKAWPNERERIKQERDPLTPSKAFFKSMALIDKSIEQFHKGYLNCMSNTSEENHELKVRVDELETLNASLQDEASRSRQKTETIRNLQQERDDLTRKVERTDERLASLVKSKVIIVDKDKENNTAASSSPNSNKESNFHCVKSYIHKLESERERHLAEIQLLKSGAKNKNSENDNESSTSAAADPSEDDAGENESGSLVGSSSTTSDDIKINNEIILDHDLGSRWHTLQENEEATALAASKEQQVNKLCAKVAERESALISIRSETKLMRMQLLQLETNRNEYKSQCDSKDSALVVSQDRIANLEDEVLRTHARCATYEEDYEALKESFATQKVATNQELNNSQLDVKAQIESIRTEFEEKLQHTEEQLMEVKLDRERLVRDLKLSVEEIELERDSLRAHLSETAAAELSFMPIIQDNFNEEKKESEDLLPSENYIVSSSEAQRLRELEKDLENFNRMRGRLAEKASEQTFTIATLQEENDMKEQQLKSLNEMIETLLGKNGKDGEEGTTGGSNHNRPWGHRISNLRDRSQRRASELLSRSRHGSSMHGGSRHGSSMHGGSRHGE
jgi:hypothetical protein